MNDDLLPALAWVRATVRADDEGRRLLAAQENLGDVLDGVTVLLLTLIAAQVGPAGVDAALGQLARYLDEA